MQIEIRENVPLAPFTTFGIGGPARYFAEARNEEQVQDALRFASEQAIDVFILGGGSNILVSDAGFDGLVVKLDIKGITYREDSGRTFVDAGAGEDWDPLVAAAVDRNLAGFECLSGIPGSVGGTPVQNVGAYGQDVSETITSVRCLDRRDSSVVELSNEQCGFSYRRSIYNSTERGRYVVLSVTYILENGGPPKIVYKDLIDAFSGHTPTLAETRDSVLRIRRTKSMVIDRDDPNSRSAGSFFKNPVVDLAKLEAIRSAAGDAKVPTFPYEKNSVKVPAAWLIEKAGFPKGFRLGNAGISTNHSLALVNLGGAAAAEIAALKDLIQARVDESFGVRLEPEPIFVGF